MMLALKQPQEGYKPTDDERLIYFLAKGGQGNLRGDGKIISTQYRLETNAHALKVADQTQLTIIISIVAIVLVSLIISPIFCRIEERKYMGLKFFLQVKNKDMATLDEQVCEFMQLTGTEGGRSKKKNRLARNEQVKEEGRRVLKFVGMSSSSSSST